MRFISVTKPGIIFGNVITMSGGYFLGAPSLISLTNFIVTLVGMSLVMASGCVFNNYIDRDIDKLMERTKNRVMAQGLMSGRVAIAYALILALLGLGLLAWQTNVLTLSIALVGLVIYAGAYSLYFKRHSIYGTAIGGVAGAVPPVVGYCAVANQLDLGALSLFLILFFWQMPHSYAIAIYRFKDYAAASIPVLPVKKNIEYVKTAMFIYVLAFVVVSILPSVFEYTGVFYFVVALLSGLYWLYLSIRGFFTTDNSAWARKMFGFSILNITLLCVAIVLSYYIAL